MECICLRMHFFYAEKRWRWLWILWRSAGIDFFPYCDPENGVFQRGSETLTSLALLSITSPDPEWIALSPTHVCRGDEEAFLLDPEEYRAAE